MLRENSKGQNFQFKREYILSFLVEDKAHVLKQIVILGGLVVGGVGSPGRGVVV